VKCGCKRTGCGRSGRRTRTVIQQPVTSGADGFGQIDLTDDDNWTSYAARRAKLIEPLGGSEGNVNDQNRGVGRYRFTYWADNLTRKITPQMRIKLTDLGTARYFQIEHVIDKGFLHREIEVTATERTSG